MLRDYLRKTQDIPATKIEKGERKGNAHTYRVKNQPKHRKLRSQPLNETVVSRKKQRNGAEPQQRTQNHVERGQVVCWLGEWDGDVHTEQSSDNVERNDDRSEQCDLAENTVGARALGNAINGDLGEIVAMSPRQHLFEVPKVCHHCDNVILDVTKIKPDVHARRHLVVLIATLGETSQHVSLAAKQAHQAHDVLACVPNLAEKLGHIIRASNEDIVFDLVSLHL